MKLIKVIKNQKIQKLLNKFKNQLKNFLMKYGYSNYLNNKNYKYDKKLFFSSSSINFNSNYKKMNKGL